MKQQGIIIIIILFSYSNLKSQSPKFFTVTGYDISGTVNVNNYFDKNPENVPPFDAFIKDHEQLKPFDLDTFVVFNNPHNDMIFFDFGLQMNNNFNVNKNIRFCVGLGYFRFEKNDGLRTFSNDNTINELRTEFGFKTKHHGIYIYTINERIFNLYKPIFFALGIKTLLGVTLTAKNNYYFKQGFKTGSPNSPGFFINETIFFDEKKLNSNHLFFVKFTIPLKLIFDVKIFKFFYSAGITADNTTILNKGNYWSYGWILNTGFLFPLNKL